MREEDTLLQLDTFVKKIKSDKKDTNKWYSGTLAFGIDSGRAFDISK